VTLESRVATESDCQFAFECSGGGETRRRQSLFFHYKVAMEGKSERGRKQTQQHNTGAVRCNDRALGAHTIHPREEPRDHYALNSRDMAVSRCRGEVQVLSAARTRPVVSSANERARRTPARAPPKPSQLSASYISQTSLTMRAPAQT
jgi:hypothetical protein